MNDALSSAEVAKHVGISKGTLLRWLREGQDPEPQRHTAVGVEVRVWTARNPERGHQYKALN